jgi:hypothetical protein
MKTAKTKKSKKAVTIFLPLLALGFTSLGTSCAAGADIVGIHMSSSERIHCDYGSFDYKGIKVSVDFRDGGSTEIALTEEMISEVERLKFFKIGEWDVEVVYRQRFKTTMPISVDLRTFDDSYELVGYEVTYDGEPHMVKLNHELPEGASIAYPYGNIFTNAGTYEVVGVISKNGYTSKTLTTTLKINPADRDTTDLKFVGGSVVYNGEMRSIEAENVPEGVEVTYETFDYDSGIRINKVVNAGKYRFVAHFTDTSPNYSKIPDMEAVLEITKATYDMTNIRLDDVVKQYDGTNYEAKIVGETSLPTGVTVSYSYLDEAGQKVSDRSKVGNYTIVATFSGGDTVNYFPIEPLTAKLRIAQRVINIADKVRFEGKTENFTEGVTWSLEVETTDKFPDTVEISYENNDHMYAGEYEVKAKFKAKSPNEIVDLEELTAYLIINRVRRSVKVLNETTGEYDKEFGPSNIRINGEEASVTGYDPSVFEVESIVFTSPEDNEPVLPKDLVENESYMYVVTFQYVNEEIRNSVILSQESDIFTYIPE